MSEIITPTIESKSFEIRDIFGEMQIAVVAGSRMRDNDYDIFD